MSQLAVIYHRVSSAGQLEGFGLARQKTYAIDFAERQGWTVDKVIADEGKSAFHSKNRSEGAALFEFEAEARNGLHQGKVLVAEHIDRLSRAGAKAAAQLIWSLNECGVDVATFQDGAIYKAGSNTELMDLFRVIIMGQAAHEASMEKSNRGKANWKKRKEAIQSGEKKISAGKVPAWLVKTSEGYELNPHRAAVLNEIYDLYIGGLGIHGITVLLNERKEPVWRHGEKDQAKAKNGWFYSYVHRLLTRRTVLGEYIDSKGNTIAADFFPQAITAEKFAKAQAIIKLRQPNKVNDSARVISLLTGMVYCLCCGGGAAFLDKGANTCVRHVTKGGEVKLYARKHYRQLKCDRARRKHQCDNDTTLEYNVVEGTILQGMLPSLVERKNQNSELKALREEIAEVARQKEINEGRAANAVDLLLDSPSPILKQRLSDLEAQIAQQAKQIDTLTREAEILSVQPSTLDDLAEIEALEAELMSKEPEVANPARRRANIMLRRLIKQIDITVGGFKVWIDDTEWYEFNAEGKMLESQHVP